MGRRSASVDAMPRHTRSAASPWRARLLGLAVALAVVALASFAVVRSGESDRPVAVRMELSAFATQAEGDLATVIDEQRQVERKVAAKKAAAKKKAAAAKKAAAKKVAAAQQESTAAPNSDGDAGGSGGTAPAPAKGSAAPGVEAQVIDIVNRERSAAGCGEVRHDEGLARVARAHSADMAQRNFFSHTNPDGLGPFDRARNAGVEARAENIAAGQSTPAAVMEGWMNSEGHRANILNCDLSRVGVGRATGGSYGTYWTQLFA